MNKSARACVILAAIGLVIGYLVFLSLDPNPSGPPEHSNTFFLDTKK